MDLLFQYKNVLLTFSSLKEDFFPVFLQYLADSRDKNNGSTPTLFCVKQTIDRLELIRESDDIAASLQAASILSSWQSLCSIWPETALLDLEAEETEAFDEDSSLKNWLVNLRNISGHASDWLILTQDSSFWLNVQRYINGYEEDPGSHAVVAQNIRLSTISNRANRGTVNIFNERYNLPFRGREARRAMDEKAYKEYIEGLGRRAYELSELALCGSDPVFGKSTNVAKLWKKRSESYNYYPDEATRLSFQEKRASFQKDSALLLKTAQQYETLDADKYRKSISLLLKQSAELGSPAACFKLGSSLLEENEQEAIEYLYQAARSGIHESSYRLGQWFIETEQNLPDAERLLKQSAESGHLPSCMLLGETIYDGMLLEKKDSIALHYLESARSSFPKATYLISRIYYWGLTDVPCNRKKASLLLEQASQEGSRAAQMELERERFNQSELDCRSIQEWLVLRCTNKTPQTLYVSGYFMYHGYGGSHIRREESLKRYEEAAQKGCTEAAFSLAVHYDNGLPENEKTALYWYKKAADGALTKSYLRLGALSLKYEDAETALTNSYKQLLQIPEESEEYTEAQYILAQIDTLLRQKRNEAYPSSYELTHYANASIAFEDARRKYQLLSSKHTGSTCL